MKRSLEGVLFICLLISTMQSGCEAPTNPEDQGQCKFSQDTEQDSTSHAGVCIDCADVSLETEQQSQSKDIARAWTVDLDSASKISRIYLYSDVKEEYELVKSAVASFEWLRGASLLLASGESFDSSETDKEPPADRSTNLNALQEGENDQNTLFVFIEEETKEFSVNDKVLREEVIHVTMKRGKTTVSSFSKGLPILDEGPIERETKELSNPDRTCKENLPVPSEERAQDSPVPANLEGDSCTDHQIAKKSRKSPSILEPLLASLKKVYIASRITSTENFPRPGVDFKDLSYVLSDRLSFAYLSDCLKQLVEAKGWASQATKVMGFDARGFIYGSLLAKELGVGFLTMRKKGKLPGEKVQVRYSTEYSEDVLEILTGTIEDGDQILLVDDVIATGGTCAAGIKAIEESKRGTVLGCVSVLKIPHLHLAAQKNIAPVEFVSLL